MMMALFDQELNQKMLFAEGREEGRAEGRAEGRGEGRAEVVDAIMKNSGRDLAYALSISGVSREEYLEAKGERH